MKTVILLVLLSFINVRIVGGQNIGFVKFDNERGLEILLLISDDDTWLALPKRKPPVSFDVNDEPFM